MIFLDSIRSKLQAVHDGQARPGLVQGRPRYVYAGPLRHGTIAGEMVQGVSISGSHC